MSRCGRTVAVDGVERRRTCCLVSTSARYLSKSHSTFEEDRLSRPREDHLGVRIPSIVDYAPGCAHMLQSPGCHAARQLHQCAPVMMCTSTPGIAQVLRGMSVTHGIVRAQLVHTATLACRKASHDSAIQAHDSALIPLGLQHMVQHSSRPSHFGDISAFENTIVDTAGRRERLSKCCARYGCGQVNVRQKRYPCPTVSQGPEFRTHPHKQRNA